MSLAPIVRELLNFLSSICLCLALSVSVPIFSLSLCLVYLLPVGCLFVYCVCFLFTCKLSGCVHSLGWLYADRLSSACMLPVWFLLGVSLSSLSASLSVWYKSTLSRLSVCYCVYFLLILSLHSLECLYGDLLFSACLLSVWLLSVGNLSALSIICLFLSTIVVYICVSGICRHSTCCLSISAFFIYQLSLLSVCFLCSMITVYCLCV